MVQLPQCPRWARRSACTLYVGCVQGSTAPAHCMWGVSRAVQRLHTVCGVCPGQYSTCTLYVGCVQGSTVPAHCMWGVSRAVQHLHTSAIRWPVGPSGGDTPHRNSSSSRHSAAVQVVSAAAAARVLPLHVWAAQVHTSSTVFTSPNRNSEQPRNTHVLSHTLSTPHARVHTAPAAPCQRPCVLCCCLPCVPPPLHSDLLNVLYDKDHYKLALGQLNTAKNLIDKLAQGEAAAAAAECVGGADRERGGGCSQGLCQYGVGPWAMWLSSGCVG
jgi:hypothetical protein